MRNTARFALGNLDGFVPARDTVAHNEMLEIDRWALGGVGRGDRAASLAAYDAYEFQRSYHALYNSAR